MANSPMRSATRVAVSGSSSADFDATDRMYIVGEGDTLSSIARKFYGSAVARGRILAANGGVIRDPFFVQPGWRLRIPR
jgi:nucleoid-associated protein YgaU